jgi:hypothetical protein
VGCVDNLLILWLPGTEPKSATKHREFQSFWILV